MPIIVKTVNEVSRRAFFITEHEAERLVKNGRARRYNSQVLEEIRHPHAHKKSGKDVTAPPPPPAPPEEDPAEYGTKDMQAVKRGPGRPPKSSKPGTDTDE